MNFLKKIKGTDDKINVYKNGRNGLIIEINVVGLSATELRIKCYKNSILITSNKRQNTRRYIIKKLPYPKIRKEFMFSSEFSLDKNYIKYGILTLHVSKLKLCS